MKLPACRHQQLKTYVLPIFGEVTRARKQLISQLKLPVFSFLLPVSLIQTLHVSPSHFLVVEL